MYWGLDETDYVGLAIVGLGKQGLGINNLEEIHEGKESVRTAAAGNFRYSIYHVKKELLTMLQSILLKF